VHKIVGACIAGPHKTEDESILSEWKSDISTSGMPIKKGPRTAEYDKQKGRLSDKKCQYSVFNFVNSPTPNPPLLIS